MAENASLLDGRLFFLGAGFSAGAGVPLTNTLLPKACQIFRREAPGLFQRIKYFARDVDVDLDEQPNANDFARFCTHLDFMELREYGGGERWSSHGSRERLAPKFYLSKAICLSTPTGDKIPKLYTDFVNGLNANDIIVSFNWDVLLEHVIDQAGLSYSYTRQENKIIILKLHGSINWISGEPEYVWDKQRDFYYAPMGLDGGLIDRDIYYSSHLTNSAAWEEVRALIDPVNPLIVLPGYGKAVDTRLLSAIWYRPEFLTIHGGGISIIGLSVAQDDYIVESLFRYIFRSIVDSKRPIKIINPDKAVGDRFKSLGPKNNIQFIEQKFQDRTLNFALFKE